MFLRKFLAESRSYSRTEYRMYVGLFCMAFRYKSAQRNYRWDGYLCSHVSCIKKIAQGACCIMFVVLAANPSIAFSEIENLIIIETSTSAQRDMFRGDHRAKERERDGNTRPSCGGSYSVLAAVLKLSRGENAQKIGQQRPHSTPSMLVRSVLGRGGSNGRSSDDGCKNRSNSNRRAGRHREDIGIQNHTHDHDRYPAARSVLSDCQAFPVQLYQVFRALKGGLMYGGIRGLTIVVLLLVSVAASNTPAVSSHSARWATASCSIIRRGGSGANKTPPVVVACVPETTVKGRTAKSRLFLLSTMRNISRRCRLRRNRLFRVRPPRYNNFTPRFPLAYASWWKALQDRKKRISALGLAEGLAAEDHEVTKRAEGAQIFRAAQFWGRSATIYLSYKKMQARCALELPRITDVVERERLREVWWDQVHELNSDRMLKLCLDLRGFYLKSGQFLGTRHDFMPKIFLKKLGKLHDDVPPMTARRVSKVLSRELHVPTNELFSSLNLTHPVGSASISQVHEGVLKETGEKVAVKVQYPGAERVMMSDLRNLRALAWFLQKFELNFDILSSLKELSRQIKGEFDFRMEARTMDRMHESLEGHSRRINIPESRLATKRVLVMSYLEGESLAQLKRGAQERFVAARKRIGKSLLQELAHAWGFMIFHEGLFNADPHPGNVLIMPEERVGPIKRGFILLGLRTPKLQVGLLDWGQIKELSRNDREKVASLILAVSARHSEDIVRCFNSLGVKLSNPHDDDSIEKLALVMFDTRNIKGLDFNPFSKNNVLKLNAVKEYPQDLYFVLRTVLMFRGMAQSLGVEFSLADLWAPHASRMISSSCPPCP